MWTRLATSWPLGLIALPAVILTLLGATGEDGLWAWILGCLASLAPTALGLAKAWEIFKRAQKNGGGVSQTVVTNGFNGEAKILQAKLDGFQEAELHLSTARILETVLAMHRMVELLESSLGDLTTALSRDARTHADTLARIALTLQGIERGLDRLLKEP